MKKGLLTIAVCISTFAVAQTLNIDTLAFQDFEIAPAAPVWSFTGPVIYNSGFTGVNAAPASSPIGIGGSRAWETTTSSGGLVLDFANTVIPVGYDSIRVRFNLAAMNLNGTTGGPDNLDYVLVAYSTDGGTTFSNRIRVRGSLADNSTWAYSATGFAQNYYLPATEQVFQPTTVGPQTTLGYSTVEIVFPGTMTQLAFRITGRSSSSSDTWLVDNLVLTGENACSSSTSTLSASACGSYTTPSGNVLSSSGTYMDTIANSTGCDSVITINLAVNNASTSSMSPNACGSYTTPSGNVLSISGMYMDTIANFAGCDSVITINLTVNSTTTSSITAGSCGNYTTPSGNVLNSPGTFMDTIPNTAGCDSVITINLSITIVDISTTLNGATITSNASAATYQWIDCNNGNAPIAGETNQSYLPAANGNYAVIVTQGLCADTSACINVTSVGLIDVVPPFSIAVTPNTSSGIFVMLSSHELINATLQVTDIQGRTVLNECSLNGAMHTIDLTAQPAGIYFLRVQNGEEATVVKVVKL